MKQCPRCNHWHHSKDSDVCDRCWEDMGQMAFWHDQDDDDDTVVITDPLLWDGEVRITNLDVDEPPIDTVFDREEEARGYQ